MTSQLLEGVQIGEQGLDPKLRWRGDGGPCPFGLGCCKQPQTDWASETPWCV